MAQYEEELIAVGGGSRKPLLRVTCFKKLDFYRLCPRLAKKEVALEDQALLLASLSGLKHHVHDILLVVQNSVCFTVDERVLIPRTRVGWL